jgi:ankyrin repeat protein
MNKIFMSRSAFFSVIITLIVPLGAMKREFEEGEKKLSKKLKFLPTQSNPLTEECLENLNEQLVDAVRKRKIAQVILLLKEGASPNGTLERKRILLRILFEKVDPDTIGEELPSPIALATSNNDVAMVKLLLQAGADVNELNIFYPTPLWYLRLNEVDPDEEIAIARLLLKYGADINKPNSNGHRFLHVALNHYTDIPLKYNLINLFLSYGANVRLPGYEGNRDAVDVLVQHIAERNIIQPFDESIFRLLLRYGGQLPSANKNFVSILMSRAFSIVLAGKIPAYDTLSTAHFIPAILEHDAAMVKKLLQENKAVVKDADGYSALVYAANQESPEILELLLAQPVYAKDFEGIEQALTIIKNRLKGIMPNSSEYNWLQTRYRLLYNALTDPIVKRASEEVAINLPALPPEIWHHILGYVPTASLPVLLSLSQYFRTGESPLRRP